MLDSNLLATLSSQPIWLQVFIGLVLFFIGLPLLVLLASVSLGTIGDLLSGLKEKPPTGKKVETQPAQIDRDEISDAQLLQALRRISPGDTEADIKSFLRSKSRLEKRGLKQNKRVLEALGKLRNESGDTTSTCGRN